MKIQGKTFNNEKILIDGNYYFDCKFNNCELEYSGGTPPSFVECEITDTLFSFSGQASATLQFMNAMYHGGFRPIIEQTFDNIRLHRFPSKAEAD